MATVKVMSFNIWVGGQRPERSEKVRRLIHSYSPDILGIQELDRAFNEEFPADPILSRDYGCILQRRDGETGEANPIYYKKEVFDLVESGTRWLSDTPLTVSKFPQSSLNRIFTYAVLSCKADGSKLLAVNTHLDHRSEEARDLQAAVLADFINTYDLPVVLTGDFNTSPDSNCYRIVSESGLVDSGRLLGDDRPFTFTSFGNAAIIIDYVFTKNGAEAVWCRVCNEQVEGEFPSDHHPVLAQVKF
ncbi:MAG: endonuclease/exonuclease/phosphatase family protein [Clostridia bacterium]|nr:endonuclease/exonuclease/phosphatase family protein [Clostridia bacterium]